jgi:uncharacterized membrane protein
MMSRRGLLIALIVSLAVNLFLLGGLAGAALMGGRPHGPPPGPAGPPRLLAIGEHLPPERREAWRTAVRQAGQTAGPKLMESRRRRQEAWRALGRDPADPQAALAGLASARALELEARGEMDQAVARFVATLPLEERRAVAETLGRDRPRGPGSGRSGRDFGPEGPGRALPNG